MNLMEEILNNSIHIEWTTLIHEHIAWYSWTWVWLKTDMFKASSNCITNENSQIKITLQAFIYINIKQESVMIQ